MEGRVRSLLHRRLGFLRGGVWVMILGLLSAYFWVQVVLRREMREAAQRQAVKNRTTPAPRGILFDRNGHKLVDNRRALNLVIQAEDLPKDLAQVEALAPLLGREPAELKRRIAASRQGAGNRLVVLQANLDEAGLAQAELLRARFPFLSIQAAPRRVYLGEGLAGHALGYVGEVDERLLAEAPERYRLGEIVGRAGFEAAHNDLIKGEDGMRRILVDQLGREVALYSVKEPVPGQSAYLTLDAGLQQVLAESFGAENGAGVVLDLRDGGILAMYSSPTMDPNLFLDRLTQEQVDYFWRNPARPMLNRATQGLYPPGSTFKLLMAVAALEKGIITPSTVIHCPGGKNFYGRFFRCEHVHGPMTLLPAISGSCNSYFFELGSRLDIDEIHAAALKYGLVGKSGVDLPAESPSRVPSRAWKAKVGKTAEARKWYAGETISVAIGQGDNGLTPLALARFYGVLATRGKLLTPHLFYGRRNEATGALEVVPPPPAQDTGLDPRFAEVLEEGLHQVVQQGTAKASRLEAVEMVGKTGTAQVRAFKDLKQYASFEKRFKDHALFAGYAPRENPQIAFAVVVENAGFGASSAAPVAKRVCQYWFVDRLTKPLPPPGTVPRPAPVAPAPAEGAAP